ncbi:MAG: putative bifunctional diguanylate cyclase/phosphodiesterase [Vicinamibacterales bacterium]
MKQESLSVLLIEDDNLEAGLIRDEIASFPRTSVQVDHVQRLLAGISRLAERRYDVVLLDLNLPDGSGIESLHGVKAAAPNAPVIILTNMEDEEAAVGMVAEGAQDYVIKRQITADLLRRSIRYAIARQEAEASLRASEERYALAVAGARDGIWDWDLIRGEIHFSPRWFELLQLHNGDAQSTPATWFDRVHPEDQVGLDQALNAHLRGDTPYLEHEFRMGNGAGQTIWTLCRAAAVRDATGRATRIAGSLTDISDRKLAEARLVHEVLHDTLTGLPNRALFLDRLGLALKQQRRDPKRTFAVLFLDLDGFKTINDSLGHAAGDELLIEFGKRLSMFLRPGDSVARLGGDEFAILLTDISGITEATRVAERVHDLLSLKFVIGDKEVYATASIGIAVSEPKYERPGDLLRDADMAMYRAKSSRSGSYSVFHSVMYESTLQRLELETDLRSALSRNELVTYYQPIVSLEQLQVLGFEALLRWFHPVRGVIGPDVFIPLAEKCGVIGPLSWWAMRDACRQTRDWQASDPRFANLSISVNVSSRMFAEPEFANRTADILEKTGLRPESLHLEITENALLQHESTTMAELTTLRKLGVKFHLDDFGTGYASLSYLNRFSYDTIKIDRSFIASSDAARSRRIIDALISLGGVLGMEVIAEGVETEEQAQKLRDLNCRFAQGFLFSKPLPSDLARALLVRANGIIPGSTSSPA